MKRREFLLGAVGAGGALAASSAQAAGSPQGGVPAGAHPDTVGRGSSLYQEDSPENNDDDEENGEDGNDEVVVELVDYAYVPGTDQPLEIEPGTTVRFVWITDTHNIAITSAPEDSDWEGVPDVHDAGFEHEHTFTVEGTYEFECTPHVGLGMIGSIIVGEIPDDPVAAPPEFDPHEVGVPLQKHFIGIATFFAIALTLVFTFYVLKYGETPHSGSPNRK